MNPGSYQTSVASGQRLAICYVLFLSQVDFFFKQFLVFLRIAYAPSGINKLGDLKAALR